MELFLADYDPLWTLFNDQSLALAQEDYDRLISPGEDSRVEEMQRLEYARLFTEIEFLVRHWDPVKIPNPTLVVQGSFPNSHYLLLSQLFPELSLELWDFRNLQTHLLVQNNQRIEIHNQDLDENLALELYRDREQILFCSYLNIDLVSTREVNFEKFWNEQHAYQANLLRAIKPRLSNLTFAVPFPNKEGPENYQYFRGFITPPFLSTKLYDNQERMCRCVPILENENLVRCNYSASWFAQTLNYWNLAAKQGKLLRNSFTRASYIDTNKGFLYCGLEICRILDTLGNYLRFAGISGDLSSALVLEKVLSLLDHFDSVLGEMKVNYSLQQYSYRYRPQTKEQSLNLTPLPSIQIRENIILPNELTRARALLQCPEETLTDLTL